MTVKARKVRVNKVAIAEEAWHAAYIEDATFTALGLAARLRMPANRHFRQYLNSLASKGLLLVARRLDDDGHYRKYFYPNRTIQMFQPKGKEKIA